MQKWEYLVLAFEHNRLVKLATGTPADAVTSMGRMFGIGRGGESVQNAPNKLGQDGWDVQDAMGMLKGPKSLTEALLKERETERSREHRIIADGHDL